MAKSSGKSESQRKSKKKPRKLIGDPPIVEQCLACHACEDKQAGSLVFCDGAGGFSVIAPPTADGQVLKWDGVAGKFVWANA